MEFSFSLEQVQEFATRFWKEYDKANPSDPVSQARVIAFHGAMGTGKTTFIHALCDVKKVKDTVGSPTFSIINEYAYEENGQEKMIYHIDLYRLENEDEAIRAGVEECFYSDHTCLVEWPEKAPGILPDNTIHVYIELVDSDTRRLKIGNK